MNTLTYPPLVESKLPAFAKNEYGITITIPFRLSKAISYDEFDNLEIRLKTITTGVEKYVGQISKSQITYDKTKGLYVALFGISQKEDYDKILSGHYYKVQLAFLNQNYRSPWSSVGIIKCTGKTSLTFTNLRYGINNMNPVQFVGQYCNSDITEKAYSYCFTIYDEHNQVFETSGEILHDGGSDELIDNQYYAHDTWTSTKNLNPTHRYYITYKVTTLNGYVGSSAPHAIREFNTVDIDFPAKLLATNDYDNGCIHLSLMKPKESYYETALAGNFVISRRDNRTQNWHQVYKFTINTQTPSEIGLIWSDYTVEHGELYQYCLQAYNINGLYSQRIYHVVANPYDLTSYLDTDAFIMADYEDAFLTDGDRQLKIKYNPKVSTFKPTILETKVDTLGGQYPFIFRNGNVNYKEMAISGLLSYLSDDNEMFMQGIRPLEYDLQRKTTPADLLEQDTIPEAGNKLTSDNFYRERQFKMQALAWLTNGKPKLFRSPGEGNYIVQLMNVNLSPNETLGRMLHTFNATAYEIAECSEQNLKDLNLMYIPEIKQVEGLCFCAHPIKKHYKPIHNMYNVFITGAVPYTKYLITQRAESMLINTEIEIGITGTYYFDPDTYPITEIVKINNFNDVDGAEVHYGYKTMITEKEFSYIKNITYRDNVIQLLGRGEDVNLIAPLENVKTSLCRTCAMAIKARPIINVYGSSNKMSYYVDAAQTIPVDTWMNTAIYYDVNNNCYYSGIPTPSSIMDTPTYTFILNDNPIVDMSKTTQNNVVGAKWVQNGYYFNGDIGPLTQLYLGTGLYTDIAYEIKTIDYAVEDIDPAVISAKENWLQLQEQYNNNNDVVSFDMVENAYNEFISQLTIALNKLEEGDVNNAI